MFEHRKAGPFDVACHHFCIAEILARARNCALVFGILQVILVYLLLEIRQVSRVTATRLYHFFHLALPLSVKLDEYIVVERLLGRCRLSLFFLSGLI